MTSDKTFQLSSLEVSDLKYIKNSFEEDHKDLDILEYCLQQNKIATGYWNLLFINLGI